MYAVTLQSSDSLSTDCDAGDKFLQQLSCLVNALQSEMGKGMHVHGSTFLWFIPFVQSVMEFSLINSICIGEIIHYLINNVNKDVLEGLTEVCDKVTEFFIRILVYMIGFHLRKDSMETMFYYAHLWVDIVVQCATLSDDNCKSGCNSTYLPSGRGTQMPALGVGAISHACKELIRSLLKKGGQRVSESVYFLDAINKHLRGVPDSGWNVTKSENENLKKCLFKIVKAISDRPAVSNDILPCAPLTPPSDPPENAIFFPKSMLTLPLQQLETKDVEVGPSGPVYKDEPLWEHGECQGSVCNGHDEIIQAKKEPYNPIPISEFRPPTEVPCIKPDLGKIQEIRSRLNDNHNLSRIQAIAKRRLETDDQGKSSISEEIGHSSIVSPQPSTSQSTIPDSARPSMSPKIKLDDDDEPLDVRRRRLKRSVSSREDDSTDVRHFPIQLANIAKEVPESDIITISDEDVPSNDKKELENKPTRDHSLDCEFNKSPGRDYDDLSESQVFEFETQENVASVWKEPHTDFPDVTKRRKLENDSKTCISPEAVECMETQPVLDEDIEKACLQAEAQICQKQQPLEPSSSMQVLPKPRSTGFIESKHSGSPLEKTVLTDKKGKQLLIRKPPVVIEALNQKIKQRHRSHTISQDPVKRCSSKMLASSSAASPPTVASSRGCSASSAARSPSTPAIVPPKKVRKPVEPKSAAERLGLKKKERKAFDLSQRSLDSLGELRSHGQTVHVELQQKSKRVRQKKFGVKGQLLGSQDRQFFKQSRGMLQRSTPAAAAVANTQKCPAPDTLPKSKPAAETLMELSDPEDDYYFLPCSQPDPDRQMDSKMGTSLSKDSKKPSNWTENIESKECNSLQNDKGAGGSMARIAESRDENCVDDEWTYLTQNEPTDMELCSQMEQMEEAYGENLIAGCVRKDTDSGNHPNGPEGETSVPLKPLSASIPQKSIPDASTSASSNDHVFLKPSMPAGYQKKAKPSTTKIYSSSSRSASLAKEMGKVVNPAANVAKAKVARPLPAMQLPPPKSIPHHEFYQPLPPSPTQHRPNQVSESSLSNVTSASHVPSYKTYPRPEAPASTQMPTAAQDQRFDKFQIDSLHLIRKILKWDFSMFENKRSETVDMSPLLPYEKVPPTFLDFKEYFHILCALLQLNAFEKVSFTVSLCTAMKLAPVHNVLCTALRTVACLI